MFPACYGLANPLCAHISRMIVVERGLNILGAPIAERPAQPGFRRRTDGPYTWISFLKAFILSNPRVAATFTVLRATVSGTLVPPYAGPFLFMALTEHPRDTTGPETSALPLRPRFNAAACPGRSRTWCFTISPCGWPTCGATAENMCLLFAAIRTVITMPRWMSAGSPTT
jgi:hypothetical protein